MVMVSNNPTDSEASKALKVMREQQKRMEEAEKSFLRGRAVADAEKEAKSSIENAQNKSASIIADAEAKKAEAAKILEEANKALESAKNRQSGIALKEREVNDREKKLSDIEVDLKKRETALQAAKATIDAEHQKYRSKLSEIDKVLRGLIDG